MSGLPPLTELEAAFVDASLRVVTDAAAGVNQHLAGFAARCVAAAFAALRVERELLGLLLVCVAEEMTGLGVGIGAALLPGLRRSAGSFAAPRPFMIIKPTLKQLFASPPSQPF